MPALQNQILQSFRAYRELKRATLPVAGDSLLITGLPVLPYLKVELHIRRIGNLDVRVRFNGDAGGNYNWRTVNDDGAVVFANNQTSARLVLSTTSQHISFEGFMHNHAGLEKTLRFNGAGSGSLGAGNQGVILEQSGKWTNLPERITSIELINIDTGDLDVETQMIVSGHG